MFGHVCRAATAFAFAALLSLGAYAQAAAPQMHDQNGSAFTLESLGGMPMVLTFVSAHCLDACPIINAQFEAMQRQVRRSHLHVRLVTLSLDPEHDRATDMRRIARTFNADPHYWVVGSGTPASTHALMHRFNVTATRGDRQYDDIHTTFVYLLDKHARLVHTMLASTNLPADLFAALQRNWNRLDV